MITTFEFSPKNAEQAGNAARTLLQAGSGLYNVVIKQADIEELTSGAQSLHLWVADSSDLQASLTLWLYGKDGSRLFGHNFLDAIMGLLDIKTINAKPANVYYWRDPKNTPPTAGHRLLELEKKTIGVVLQKVTDYNRLWEDKDGVKHPSVSLQIVHVCDPTTQQTYAEKSANTEAKLVAKCLGKLTDKVVGEPPKDGFTSAPKPATASTASPLDLDEDCPF